MIFDDIDSLLRWYFNKRWLKPPKPPGNHDPNHVYGYNGVSETHDICVAIFNIKKAVQEMAFRDRSLIRQYYTRVSLSALAKRRRCCERTIKRRINRINDDLIYRFKNIFLLSDEAISPISGAYLETET